MNNQILFLAIYRALECLEEEQQGIKIDEFLDKANPYVFKDRKSADPSIYDEYSIWLDNSGITVTDESSFDIAKKYVGNMGYEGILETIDEVEWKALITLIKSEEPQLLQKP